MDFVHENHKDYNKSMQKDPLEKLETTPSTLPRHTNRSLAKLPQPKRRVPLTVLIVVVLALIAGGVWLAIR